MFCAPRSSVATCWSENIQRKDAKAQNFLENFSFAPLRLCALALKIMTKVIITGAKGRMGQALVACAKRIPGVEVVAQIDQGDDLAAVIGNGDVVIDFSAHAATVAVAQLCAKHKKPLVIGTTGHTDTDTFEIKQHTKKIPIVWASNFSTGVNTLFWLTRKTAEILGPEFDLEVVEMHHRQKKDAPSGTAKTLAEILDRKSVVQGQRRGL